MCTMCWGVNMRIKGRFNNEELQVIETQFEVTDVESIHFRLLEGAFEHFFVIVKDPKQQIRALLTYKTRKKDYCLSPFILTSDNYTVPGVLWNGAWTIQIVRTYPVEGEFTLAVDFNQGTSVQSGKNCLIEPADALYDDREGWYRGDLHLHTAFSDGRVTHEEVIEAALRQNLDFIALSEHSSVTTKFPESSLLVLPSTEVTWDDDGHYNIHGLRKIPDYAGYVIGAKIKSEALNQMFQEYHRQDCLLSINHPFPRGWVLRHNFDIRSFQTMEVINAPHLLDQEVDNEKAVRFFDFLWLHGYLLYAVGGSDAHKNNYFETYPAALPTTKVYCKGLSVEHILDAAKKGRSYLQVYHNFEIAYRRPGDPKALVLPGEQAEGLVEMKARCRATVTWQLVKNGDVIRETVRKSFCEIVDIKENDYYRLQARDFENELVLFVNPVHNMKKQTDEFWFQSILTLFEEAGG